jgi:hypothetical protein
MLFAAHLGDESPELMIGLDPVLRAMHAAL